jgi:hypothetical protein
MKIDLPTQPFGFDVSLTIINKENQSIPARPVIQQEKYAPDTRGKWDKQEKQHEPNKAKFLWLAKLGGVACLADRYPTIHLIFIDHIIECNHKNLRNHYTHILDIESKII